MLFLWRISALKVIIITLEINEILWRFNFFFNEWIRKFT